MNPLFDPSRISIHLSGDAEKDAAEAASMRRQLANLSEGLCPNGCAPLVWLKGDDDVAHCPSCRFHGFHFHRRDYDPLFHPIAPLDGDSKD